MSDLPYDLNELSEESGRGTEPGKGGMAYQVRRAAVNGPTPAG
jgi:hypothetical protein